MVSPEGLLADSDAAEAAIVFTPKEGERGSLWHGGGVEMLKSVCNPRVQRPMSVGGWCVVSARDEETKPRLDCRRVLGAF